MSRLPTASPETRTPHPFTSVVLFAGLGGSCEGIRQATGQSPKLAINHCAHALWLHKLNHPETLHLEEDVWNVSPKDAVHPGSVDLLWLSPSCTHFSRARGAAPKDPQLRALADVGIPWAQEIRPEYILLENVVEFEDWGPVDDDGQPIRDQSGESFKEWVASIRAAGYSVEWRSLIASEYGTPTSRERLYLVARRDGKRVVWPEATHGAGKLPFRTAEECIDWEIQGKPIFGRIRELQPKTLHRIAVGREKYGDDPFLISYYGTSTAVSIKEPLDTVTTKDRFGLVVGDTLRMLQPRELARAMGFPESYILAGTKKEQVARIGNAVCPTMARVLVEANCLK